MIYGHKVRPSYLEMNSLLQNIEIFHLDFIFPPMEPKVLPIFLHHIFEFTTNLPTYHSPFIANLHLEFVTNLCS